MANKFNLCFGKVDDRGKKPYGKYIPSHEREGFDESKVIKVKPNKAHRWKDYGDMPRVFDSKTGRRNRDR